MDVLNDVAVFVAVVDEGSFTRAAERLSLSRSVVSKYVTRLEDALGARLLYRTTRRLSLTEAGRIFYERSSSGLDAIDDARAEVSSLQDEPRGVLRVNSPMSFGILHLAPLLPGFLERYPKVSVDMNLDDRKLDVIEAGFDVSLRISEMPDSSLVARRLAPCRHVVVAAPSYLERRGAPRSPEELASHDIIRFSLQQSGDVWHFLDREGRAIQVTVGGRLVMNNSLALREALLGGAGITRTPTFLVGDELRDGRLVQLLGAYRTLEVSIFLVYPQRRHLSPKVRAFVDYVADRMGEEPPWDVAPGH